jgi:hypothetical protein
MLKAEKKNGEERVGEGKYGEKGEKEETVRKKKNKNKGKNKK